MRDAIDRLDDAGHVAYVVGGSVRDFLLNRPAKDHDIATSATPDEIVALFPNSIEVGRHFGVLKVPISSGVLLEIATFREDLEYLNHRHPSKVRFAGPEEDARRRDFTINAIYYDPKTHRLLDSVGGIEDLRLKRVSAIGKASDRFREDALRLLRAVRFATRLDFEIDQETDLAIRERAKLILKVSVERVREELNAMLVGARAAQAVALLSNTGLLPHLLPEIESLRTIAESPAIGSDAGGTVFQHTLKVVDTLVRQNPAERPIELVWAALLHSAGKAEAHGRSGGKSFNGHEVEGARIAREITTRLKFPKEQSERIALLIEDQLKFAGVFQMRESTLQRFVASPGFDLLLALHRAQATCSDGNLAAYEFCASRLKENQGAGISPDARLLKGEDLVELGLPPGPRFSEILRDIEDLALEGRLKSKDEALEYVVKHYVR